MTMCSRHWPSCTFCIAGAICKEKPNNKWTTDVYLDFLVLSGDGVPRQVMHVQGESLRDLLKGKKKHHRQLRLQTSFLGKHLRQQMEANSLEILRAGIGKPTREPPIMLSMTMPFGIILCVLHKRAHLDKGGKYAVLSTLGCSLTDTGNGPWPCQRTSEGMSGEVCGILELRTVLQLHQQRCNICENDIQALQAILKQEKGTFKLIILTMEALTLYTQIHVAAALRTTFYWQKSLMAFVFCNRSIKGHAMHSKGLHYSRSV